MGFHAFARRSAPLLLSVLLGASLGCNFVEAKSQGEAIAETSFTARAAGDTEVALGLYDERVAPREEWRGLLEKIEQRLGRPGERSLTRVDVHWGDQGAGTGTYATLDYAVAYTQDSATERIIVYTPVDEGSPRIVGHHLDSKSFR